MYNSLHSTRRGGRKLEFSPNISPPPLSPFPGPLPPKQLQPKVLVILYLRLQRWKVHHRFALRPQMSDLFLRKQTKLKAVRSLPFFLFKKINRSCGFSLFLVGYITLYNQHTLLTPVEGLKLSNSLSTEIRNASSIAEFTSKLKSSFTVIVYF